MNKTNVNQFMINYKSEDTGEMFEGNFSCRRQSIIDKSRINRRRSELAGGYYCVKDENGNPTGQGIDESSEWFCYAVAVLETVIETSPDWYDLDKVYDDGLIFSIFKEVMDYENSFRRSRRVADSEQEVGRSGENSSTEKSQNTHTSNNPTQVVDRQIQDALDA